MRGSSSPASVACRIRTARSDMRHRAILFGIVGGLLLAAAFHPALRTAAVAAGLTSMLSFVVIAMLQGGANPQIDRVVWVDVVASAALIAAAVLDRMTNH